MTIKLLIKLLAALLIILLLILIIRTTTYPFIKNKNKSTSSQIKIEVSELALKRFSEGIRIPTISYEKIENTDFKPFDEFKEYLQKVYPEIYQTMDTLTVNKYGLVFKWKGKKPKLKPTLIIAHYDVVPAIGHTADDKGNEIFNPKDKTALPIEKYQEKWDYPPFSGAVANGRVYGRGTLDMKGVLFAILEAADNLIHEGYQPENDIWLAFGHDEEVNGTFGAAYIADYFKKEGLSFDAVYDEGGIITPPGSSMSNINKSIALIGLGEKGFLTLNLKVHGIGGHSSMPPAKSSLVYAAEIIQKLNDNQIPAKIIPPIASFLDHIGSEMDFTSRVAIANQWLLSPLLLKNLSKTPTSNALIRTTTAISMAKGSDASNILSSVSEVTVNFRILPGNTVAQTIEHVKELCKGYEVDIEPIIVKEPSHISPMNTNGCNKIKEIVTRLYPGIIVTPFISVAGTDSYKYQIVSNNIYRFTPYMLNKYEQRLFHNENEHISIDNFGKMIYFYQELMKN